MVQKHAHGDERVAWVGHCELGQMRYHRLVKADQTVVAEHQDGGGREHFAD
jgi:beta-xylosidase